MGGYLTHNKYWSIQSNADISENVNEWIKEIDTVDRIQIDGSNIKKITSKNWDILFGEIFHTKPKLYFRIYGGGAIDISFLSKYNNLQNISIEATDSIKNIHVLSQFNNLTSLHVVFDNQEDLDFLNEINPDLKNLSIYTSLKKKKNLDLSPILNFKHLTSLGISEYDLNIEKVISQLIDLKSLHLQSISKPANIDFITTLKNLEHLIIQLGGICNLDNLSKMEKIKYLQLWRIAKLNDINFISDMRGLQFINLETLNQISKFPSVRKLEKLRRVMIASCKQMKDFSELEYSNSVVDFIFQNAATQIPLDFIPILKNKKITNLGIGFSKASQQKEIGQIMKTHGKSGLTYRYPQFKEPFHFI